MNIYWKLVACFFVSVNVWGQMAHEVVLLVNEKSPDSVYVGNFYSAVRGISGQNVIYLDIPEAVYGGDASISRADFTKLIWEPTMRAIRERGLENQVLAWVYSVDFPIRVITDFSDRRQMSVGGLTFTRNVVPDLKQVEQGTYFNKLFAGPNSVLKAGMNNMSLRMRKEGVPKKVTVPAEAPWLTNGLGDEMPIPSMMLGYTGENGCDRATVVQTIARGVGGDYRGKRQGIYFVTSDDVRSSCRHGLYPSVVGELAKRKATASVVTNFPAGAQQVMGLMMGAEKVDPKQIKSFQNGAMAEHLTSWAAEFQRPQTKLTEWISAGATGSAGTVVEPYANSNKFPSPRFYTHYLSGASMLGSFYQSIACPLQSLLIGEPLTRPYSIPMTVKLIGVDKIDDDFTYVATAKLPVEKKVLYSYTYLLDGKMLKPSSDEAFVRIVAEEVGDGWHELSVVARIQHMAELGSIAKKEIVVNRLGRSISIDQDVKKIARFEHVLKVNVGGDEKPKTVKLVSGTRLLDEKTYTPAMELVVDEQLMGEGPVKVQVIATYADGMEVSSKPLMFVVKFAAE